VKFKTEPEISFLRLLESRDNPSDVGIIILSNFSHFQIKRMEHKSDLCLLYRRNILPRSFKLPRIEVFVVSGYTAYAVWPSEALVTDNVLEAEQIIATR